MKPADMQMTLSLTDKEMELSDEHLLHNIQTLQSQNNIKLSASLVKDLGRLSLDIEKETGDDDIYINDWWEKLSKIDTYFFSVLNPQKGLNTWGLH